MPQLVAMSHNSGTVCEECHQREETTYADISKEAPVMCSGHAAPEAGFRLRR